MKGYVGNIQHLSEANENFRTVIYTASHCQLVLMSLKPGEEIGEEVHSDNDQFFRIEQGEAKVVIDGEVTQITEGMVAIVPAGIRHNIINASVLAPLKLYTLYSPPHHKDGTIHKMKQDATD